jgi:hypothetical protein
MPVRAQRLNVQYIDVPLRDKAGAITRHRLFREDVLTFGEGLRYLVLDFGTEEKLQTIGTVDRSADIPITSSRNEWRPTGRIDVSIQAVDADGVGLAAPFVKQIVPPDESGITPGWAGWGIDPVSPRRATNWSAPSGERHPDHLPGV